MIRRRRRATRNRSLARRAADPRGGRGPGWRSALEGAALARRAPARAPGRDGRGVGQGRQPRRDPARLCHRVSGAVRPLSDARIARRAPSRTRPAVRRRASCCCSRARRRGRAACARPARPGLIPPRGPAPPRPPSPCERSAALGSSWNPWWYPPGPLYDYSPVRPLGFGVWGLKGVGCSSRAHGRWSRPLHAGAPPPALRAPPPAPSSARARLRRPRPHADAPVPSPRAPALRRAVDGPVAGELWALRACRLWLRRAAFLRGLWPGVRLRLGAAAARGVSAPPAGAPPGPPQGAPRPDRHGRAD
jgi:hypothetical protein